MNGNEDARPTGRYVLIGMAIVCLALLALFAEIRWTQPVRLSVQTYYNLIAAANAQDVARARSLCSQRYLAGHALQPAPEGGLVGLPRGINKNFQVWRHGIKIWLCPTNRVGPVYQFVFENGRWAFDGPIGLLLPGGQVEEFEETAAPSAARRE